jgi:uncharacterized protein (DUF2147 family)
MKKVIIITAALVMPTSVFAQGADAKPKAPAKKAAQAKKPENPGMVFIGQDGKIVDMKKDKCWNPNDRPYRAPGWC